MPLTLAHFAWRFGQLAASGGEDRLRVLAAERAELRQHQHRLFRQVREPHFRVDRHLAVAGDDLVSPRKVLAEVGAKGVDPIRFDLEPRRRLMSTV